MRILYVIAWLAILPGIAMAQVPGDTLRGRVVEASDRSGNPEYLQGVAVHWSGTAVGVLTKEGGDFAIPRVEGASKLVFSLVNYASDTLDSDRQDFLQVQLRPIRPQIDGFTTDTVEITSRLKTTNISTVDPIKTEVISERELMKAACCNLAESFETTPSVDVSFTDAVTGTRQIQMLGLAGPYTQILREAMPGIYGFAAIEGLGYIPGTWIESIQLNKGTGSVMNGFESVAGQINVNLRRPEKMDRFFLNVYGNLMGRAEVNSHIRKKFSDKWSTALLLHGRLNRIRNDRNEDGFLDLPLTQRFIGLNRWKYIGESGFRFQAGVKATLSDDIGGQLEFAPENQMTPALWGMEKKTRRYSGWAKFGKVYPEKPWKSMGFQVSGAFHDHRSMFGQRRYDSRQNSLYANYLFKSMIGSTKHTFTTGASFRYDDYWEQLETPVFARTEWVPGAFLEYNYSLPERLDVVAGLRADYHNLFGFFATPRLHIRYVIAPQSILRLSAGRGQRTANVISENTGLLASSREIIIRGTDNSLPYGLNPEVAWNFGINFTQKFVLDYREGSFSVDYYRTDFINQIVIDLDQSPGQAVFYNLDGQSFSNSFQAQLDYEVVKRLDVRLAYRWFDVRTTYDGVLRSKPLVAPHRAFINLGYKSRSLWAFDATLNWQGAKRIPITESNPVAFRLPAQSDPFFLLNAQISKSWREKWDVYLGGENLLNFRQPNAILASDQPFSSFFDSSMIWGPVFGRMVYAGMRFRLR